MPPVNPQGSRSGLVAAVVTFTVLFVAATIFAIYYGVQDSKAEESLTALNSKFRSIAIDINSPDVADLTQQARSDPALSETTALAEAIHQRDNLRRMIVGLQAAPDQPADTATQSQINDVETQATQAIAQANTVLGGSVGKMSSSSLVEAISDMTLAMKNLTAAAATAVAERNLARAEAANDAKAAQMAQLLANKGIDAAKEELQEQLDAASDAIKKAQDQLDAAKQTFSDEQNASSTALDSADKQRAQLAGTIDTLNREINGLRDKLAGRRIDVQEPIVRRAEGEVVEVADPNTLYINLGQGDQVVPGMTFEVYDKSAPIPKLGDGVSDLKMPVGKASIEVTRVLPDGSECHISQVTPGQVIVQGDPIVNLVYDRNAKFSFFVYGDFDITRSGHPTAGGTDIIKRVITQWGGRIDPRLDVETDFVVVGTPPDVPVFTADELKDPINEQKLANFKRASDEYDKVVEKAEELHVPIMNQNKFLFFTGYYDLALR